MKTYQAHIISGITQDQLKVGMYITNHGSAPIPIYNSVDATGEVAFTVAPGELIGQIVDMGNGPNGYVVGVTSVKVDEHSSIMDKVDNFLLGWTGTVALVGTINFADLKDSINTEYIAKQNEAILQAEQSGVSFENSVKKVAKETMSVVSGAFGELWPIVLIAGVLFIASHTSVKTKQFNYKPS